jgi:hypothetical protein
MFQSTQLFKVYISVLTMFNSYTVIMLDPQQEELRDLAAVKQELNVELAAEEHQWCCRR